MKKIEEVMKDIKYGNTLIIMNDKNLKTENYSACIIKYDGRILVDVKEVEIGCFLEQIPNIKSKINSSTYYQLKYDFESCIYQSAIMHKVKHGGYKEPDLDEVLEDLVVENFDLIDSILDLDIKIVQRMNEATRISKKKELAS